MEEEHINQTRTELHTHLMGMLTADAFIMFILGNNVHEIFWPLDDPDFDNLNEKPLINVWTNQYYKKELMDALRIKHGDSVDYEEGLFRMYDVRKHLLQYIILKQPDFKDNPSAVKARVYNNYINECLRELISQGVEYVEISYSIDREIKRFVMADDVKGKIECRFVLSTDRTNPVNGVKSSAKTLRKLMKQGLSVGFDFMGAESALGPEEKDINNEKSLEKKMEYIARELIHYQGSTLRIHSGETPESRKNTITTLKMLDNVKETLLKENPDMNADSIFPPPEIRIGHGLHFEKSEEYIDMLKKYNCVIEINASSNKALKNIESYDDIPYNYYIDKGIPVVLSTDGHGLYDTTIGLEDSIAAERLTSDKYQVIQDYDQEVINQKGAR